MANACSTSISTLALMLSANMSKLFVVFGATGQQGGSIVDHVINDSELSKQYTIRAVSRNATSDGAKQLSAKGVEVVTADPNDPPTLRPALEGAHIVFGMTFPDFRDVRNSEVRQGRAIIDAAVAGKAQYFIFSTLPWVSKISGGKYTKVAGFDAKAEVEEYIRQQPIRSAFFAPGSFMQNYHSVMKPRKTPDGTYSISRHVSPKTQLPMIDTVGDAGKFVGAILADLDKYEGKTFCAATKVYSMEEQAQILSKHTGKPVVYKQLPEDVFRSFLPNTGYTDILIQMMSYQQDFGYYGADTEELVAWAVKNARGEVTTFEEYLEKNPLDLE
ncbi:NmrA-like domain-containing protein 1 [Lithohypha guttulata]|uniref:NmrA-like domain-containing protein 1 n=1 Tax=Lithohypha guttulata TaxID=1690604 RepID=A0ABR0JZ02_9EURO|nr:NmrA-like domain-containing protein 1 [Lithohypha guttulata]